jgi:hypothetical protein
MNDLQKALDKVNGFLNNLKDLKCEEVKDCARDTISDVLKLLDAGSILRFRWKLVKLREANKSIEFLEECVELIDGQLALREIAGTDAWR